MLWNTFLYLSWKGRRFNGGIPMLNKRYIILGIVLIISLTIFLVKDYYKAVSYTQYPITVNKKVKKLSNFRKANLATLYLMLELLNHRNK